MILKRILTLLLSALLILSLVGCGEDTSLVRHEHEEIGITLALPKSFTYEPYGQRGVYATYTNEKGNCAVLLLYFDNATLLSNEKLEGDISLENYIDYTLKDYHGVDGIDVSYSSSGTTATFSLASAESENEEPQFVYFTVIKGERGIYVTQMICSATDSEIYREEFVRWSKEIKVNPS